MTLPTWMRGALFATAVMNGVASIIFLPASQGLRALAGMPDGEPFYLATVSMFVLLFGIGYLWCAVTGRADRLFIALAAIGKLSFVTLVVSFWAAGALPWRAALTGMGDLPFGLLFLKWLFAGAVDEPAAARHAHAR
jgi:hypothetical protein